MHKVKYVKPEAKDLGPAAPILGKCKQGNADNIGDCTNGNVNTNPDGNCFNGNDNTGYRGCQNGNHNVG